MRPARCPIPDSGFFREIAPRRARVEPIAGGTRGLGKMENEGRRLVSRIPIPRGEISGRRRLRAADLRARGESPDPAERPAEVLTALAVLPPKWDMVRVKANHIPRQEVSRWHRKIRHTHS
jgi:hypothetical protein